MRALRLPQRTPPRARAGLVTGLVLGLLTIQLALAPPALAFTCTLVDGGQTANVVLDPGVDHGGSVGVIRDGDIVKFQGVSCGNVNTVRTMNIDMANQFEALFFHLAGGHLGIPSRDIVFNVSNVSQNANMGVLGSTGDDHVTFGQKLIIPGLIVAQVINLNADDTTNNDVIVKGRPEHFDVVGNAGSDELTGGGTGVVATVPVTVPLEFTGGAGADRLVGGSANDIDLAEPGPDSGDSFAGGAGADTLDMHGRTAGMSISLNGTDDDGIGCPGGGCEGDNIAKDVETILTGSGNDTLTGAAGGQVLDAGEGSNSLFGRGGPDTLRLSGSGPDDAHGGAGIDIASYEFHAEGVTVSIDDQADDGHNTEGDNVHTDIEQLYGSPEGDQLTGNAENNRLFGQLGNDVLNGLGGNDSLDGGGSLFLGSTPSDGSDTFLGGPGVDTVTEAVHTAGMTLSIDGNPNDVVNGQPAQGTDNITTDVENVIGGPFDDAITGSAADNRLVGGDGKDELRGNGGDDVLVPGPDDDSVFGGPGLDTASFADAAAAVTASLDQGTALGDGGDTLSGLERLTGSPQGDRLTGSPGPNLLTGGDGDDVLRGLAGNDRLVGGGGDDTLTGGLGTDTCVQGAGSGPATGCEH